MTTAERDAAVASAEAELARLRKVEPSDPWMDFCQVCFDVGGPQHLPCWLWRPWGTFGGSGALAVAS